MPETDILILGGSGFIGGRMAQLAQRAGLQVAATHLHHPVPSAARAFRLELTNRVALAQCLTSTQPRVIIHCAATFTPGTLDAATQHHVSVESLRCLLDAVRAAEVDAVKAARIIYVSTNAVFSGQDGPYAEHDRPDPDHRQDDYRHYGMARWAGEELLLNEWPRGIVARTANVDGRNAWGEINPRLNRLTAPLRAGQPLARFIDRVISPTWVDTVAAALVEMCLPGFDVMPDLPHSEKIFHLCGMPMTDYAYALLLARQLGVSPDLIQEDHCLPAGSSSVYNIGMTTASTQPRLQTPLLDAEAMLACVFSNG